MAFVDYTNSFNTYCFFDHTSSRVITSCNATFLTSEGNIIDCETSIPEFFVPLPTECEQDPNHLKTHLTNLLEAMPIKRQTQAACKISILLTTQPLVD